MVTNIINKMIEYNEDVDSIYIYRYNEEKSIYGSIQIGNFIFDIDTTGTLVGIEIDNASEVLNLKPGVLSNLLANVSETKIDVSGHNNAIMITYSIKTIGNMNNNIVGMCAIPKNKISIKH